MAIYSRTEKAAVAIRNKSPHLAGVLHRLKQQKPHLDIDSLDEVFDYAIRNGGLEELDFCRDPEVSFNPRPARIALILVQDAGVSSTEVIAAGILASVWPSDNGAEELRESIALPVAELSRESHCNPLELIERSSKNEVNFASIIATSLWLDRARHFHLSEKKNQALDAKEFLEQTESYIKLAESCSERLHTLLSSWFQRVERKLRKPLVQI